MKKNFAFGIIIIVLIVIIVVLSVLLMTPRASDQGIATTTPVVATTTDTAPPSTTKPPVSNPPASVSVQVSSPKSGASVGSAFDVTGVAPNGWYFEASFPTQVRDEEGNIIGNAPAQAQTDWTVPGPVSFVAHMTITGGYHGAAKLILLKDNPSGLPENDDSVTVPIVIQ